MPRNTQSSPKPLVTKPVVTKQVVPINQPTVLTIPPQSLGQTMKEGFGLGVGLSVGRNIVDGVFNMFSTPKSSNPKEQNKVAEYEKCLEYSSNDIEKCKTLLNN